MRPDQIKLAAHTQALARFGIEKRADALPPLPSALRRAGAGALSAALPGAAVGGGLAYLSAGPDEEHLARRVAAGAAIGGGTAAAANALRHGLSQHLRNIKADKGFDLKSQKLNKEFLERSDALRARKDRSLEELADMHQLHRARAEGAYAKRLAKAEEERLNFQKSVQDLISSAGDPDIRGISPEAVIQHAQSLHDMESAGLKKDLSDRLSFLEAQRALDEHGTKQHFSKRHDALQEALKDSLNRAAATRSSTATPDPTYLERAYHALRGR